MEAANKGAWSVDPHRSVGMGISLPFEPGERRFQTFPLFRDAWLPAAAARVYFFFKVGFCDFHGRPHAAPRGRLEPLREPGAGLRVPLLLHAQVRTCMRQTFAFEPHRVWNRPPASHAARSRPL